MVTNSRFYLIDSQLENNKASQFGGGLISDTLKVDSKMQDLHFLKTIFFRNSAKIGSAFY